MKEARITGFRQTITEDKGVSLIEVTLICLIIAVVAAISVPMISGYVQGYTLRSGATQVAEKLNSGRALAMAKNSLASVSFNEASNTYGLDFTTDTNGIHAPDGIPDESDPSDLSKTYRISAPPAGVAIEYPEDGKIIITFNSRGELPIGSTEQVIAMRNSGGELTVHVNLRGRIWVQ